jgi:IS5 family transposase
MERRHLSWQRGLRVIKQQFGFQKTRLRGLARNRYKIYVMAALSNLF